MPDRIGSWAHRPGTHSHLIESQIGDRFVMRCGKVLVERIGTFEDSRLVFSAPAWSNPACLQCAGGRRSSLLLSEDGD